MASAFRAESRNVQRFVGLPGAEKVRLWPTVDAILADARSDRDDDISNQIVFGALERVLIAGIIARHYGEVYDTLGKALGVVASAGKSDVEPDAERNGHFPAGKPLPAREVRKPLAKVAR